MQSSFENSLSDRTAENYTQTYPAKPWWENHTPACLTARQSERIALAEYTEQYPNFCRKCSGTGLESWHENAAPHGSGESWPMEVSDCCPECVGAGKCPRCGKSEKFYDDDFDMLKCFACDWTPESGGAPEVLNPYDCGCDWPENG